MFDPVSTDQFGYLASYIIDADGSAKARNLYV